MKKWLVGCLVVVCCALAIVPVKSYFDINVLEHPYGSASVGITGVYFDGSVNAVFLNVSVWDAPFGVMNFNRATINDGVGNVVARDEGFNVTLAQGESRVLRVNCNCSVLRGYEVVVGDDYNWWSIPLAQDGVAQP